MSQFPGYWKNIQSKDQISAIFDSSYHPIQTIFKHSTRCGLSSLKLQVLTSWSLQNPLIPIHFLDVIQYRLISNLIEEKWQVLHETPQVLFIHQGLCIYHADHMRITDKALDTQINQLKNYGTTSDS